MITAIDSSVLFDVFGAHRQFGEFSAQALKQAVGEGRVLACPVVWSEVSTQFADEAAVSAALGAIPVGFSELDAACAFFAGVVWKNYRRNKGPRTRMLPDFLVGAHALKRCDRLLTRDAGFFRAYFKDLKVITP